jgi:hypothetical protein
MQKVVRITETDLKRIVKKVIQEKNVSKLNEGLGDDIWNAGAKAVDTVGKVAGQVADKTIEAGDKYLALKSDWWYLVPGMNGVKMTYDEVRALRAISTQTFEQTMEGIRDVASGIKGVVVAVALDATGAGEIINPVFWGLFATYDCWLWAKKGTLNMFNIIMDIISVATAGAGAAFVKGFKSVLGPVAKSGTAKFISVMKKSAPELFNYLLKILKGSKAIISKIATQTEIGIKELSKKFPFMVNKLQSMRSGVGTLKGFMTELETAVGHDVAHLGKHIVKHYGQEQVAHAGVGKLVGHGEGHGGGHGEKPKTPHTAKTIPRYIAVNGIKKPNPKFKQKYGYA